MNTLAIKVRGYCRDALLSLKNVMRRRPHVIEEPKSEYETIKADFEAVDSFCYFLLGGSIDCILDIIYHSDVTESGDKSNPLYSLFLVLVIYLLPTTLIYAELLGAVPGRTTLYSYAYTGLNEFTAVLCGWTWFGAAAARTGMFLHYFLNNILYNFSDVFDVPLLSLSMGLVIYAMLPFVDKKMSVTINIVGIVIRLVTILFLIGYVDPYLWFVYPPDSDNRYIFFSSFAYFELYDTLPIVSPVLHTGTRIKMLIRKMLVLIICVVLFHLLFFLVLFGNVVYYKERKQWIENIVGQHRPLPYLLFFMIANYWCGFCGLLSAMHGTSVLILQMSQDGMLFRFLSSSDGVRNLFFIVHSLAMFLGGYHTCRAMFDVLSSLGMVLAAACVLLLKSVGQKDFYVPSAAKVKGDLLQKRDTFMKIILKVMLIVLLIGCLTASFVVPNIFHNSFDPFSYEFALLIISICFIGLAAIVFAVTPKYRSVHSPFVCPLGPLFPIVVIAVSLMNFSLVIAKIKVPITIWLAYGTVFYLLFGLKNVTALLDPSRGDDYSRICLERQYEDWRVFEILRERLKVDQDRLARRRKAFKAIGAPPLCVRKDRSEAAKLRRFVERYVGDEDVEYVGK